MMKETTSNSVRYNNHPHLFETTDSLVSSLKIARSIGTQTEPTIFEPNLPLKQQGTELAKTTLDTLNDLKNPDVFKDDLNDTFYQKQLPTSLVRFASTEGKRLFREAMDESHAEGFFPLTGNFTTQSEPAYCGPSSLAMVLNALEVDPKRRWKGNWRWYSDELLHCCTSQEDVKKNGITFDNFACLAESHAQVEANRAFEFTFDKFKADIETVTSTSDKFIVVSFSRKTLDQTGDGHFSPIGAYNAKEGKVLILDTARYKYPSYWCPIETLFKSMQPIDKETGRPRGYFVLSYDTNHSPVNNCNTRETKPEPASTEAKLDWSTVAKPFCHQIPEDIWLHKPRTLEHVVQLVTRKVPQEYTSILVNKSLTSFRTTSLQKAREYVDELLYDTTKLSLYPIVLNALYPDTNNPNNSVDLNAAFATLFVLGSPRMLYASLPRELRDRIDNCRKDEQISPLMKQEINRISEEVADLTTTFCTCKPGWTAHSDDLTESIKIISSQADQNNKSIKNNCCKLK